MWKLGVVRDLEEGMRVTEDKCTEGQYGRSGYHMLGSGEARVCCHQDGRRLWNNEGPGGHNGNVRTYSDAGGRSRLLVGTHTSVSVVKYGRGIQEDRTAQWKSVQGHW
jgi:hypothetical protein